MLTKTTKDKLNCLIVALCDEGIRDTKSLEAPRIEALARLVEATHALPSDNSPVVGFVVHSAEDEDE